MNNTYQTDLESVTEDLLWINRNYNINETFNSFENSLIKDIPGKIKNLHDYCIFREIRLIGAIRRLSAYDRSKITELFYKLLPEVKELILPAIKNKEGIGEVFQSCTFCGDRRYGTFWQNPSKQWLCMRCHPKTTT